MRPFNGARYLAGSVPASSRVVQVARRIDATEGDLAVVDDSGKTIGIINRAALIDVFLDGNGGPGKALD
jgi:hypothetical protein